MHYFTTPTKKGVIYDKVVDEVVKCCDKNLMGNNYVNRKFRIFFNDVNKNLSCFRRK